MISSNRPSRRSTSKKVDYALWGDGEEDDEQADPVIEAITNNPNNFVEEDEIVEIVDEDAELYASDDDFSSNPALRPGKTSAANSFDKASPPKAVPAALKAPVAAIIIDIVSDDETTAQSSVLPGSEAPKSSKSSSSSDGKRVEKPKSPEKIVASAKKKRRRDDSDDEPEISIESSYGDEYEDVHQKSKKPAHKKRALSVQQAGSIPASPAHITEAPSKDHQRTPKAPMLKEPQKPETAAPKATVVETRPSVSKESQINDGNQSSLAQSVSIVAAPSQPQKSALSAPSPTADAPKPAPSASPKISVPPSPTSSISKSTTSPKPMITPNRSMKPRIGLCKPTKPLHGGNGKK